MGQPIARGRRPPLDEQVAELLHAVDTLLRLALVHGPLVQRERAVGPLLRELAVRVREILCEQHRRETARIDGVELTPSTRVRHPRTPSRTS